MAGIPHNTVRADDSDDREFIAIVHRIVSRIVGLHEPSDLYIIRVNNWFDHKWLGFAGRLVGALAVHCCDELRVPPFNPNRVVAEDAYELNEAGEYELAESAAPLHRSISSEANIRRRIHTVSESGVFVWYSTGSMENGRGSVMVYRAPDSSADGWFVSLKRVDEWQVAVYRGIGREHVEALIHPVS